MARKAKTATPAAPATPATPIAAAITAAYGTTPVPETTPAAPAPTVPPEWARPISLADLAAAEAVEAVTAAGLVFGAIGADILEVREQFLEWAATGGIGKSPWATALPTFDPERLRVIHSIVSTRVTGDDRRYANAWLALEVDKRPRPSWRWLFSLVAPPREPKTLKNASEILTDIHAAMDAVPGLETALRKALGVVYPRFVTLATKGKKGKKS